MCSILQGSRETCQRKAHWVHFNLDGEQHNDDIEHNQLVFHYTKGQKRLHAVQGGDICITLKSSNCITIALYHKQAVALFADATLPFVAVFLGLTTTTTTTTHSLHFVFRYILYYSIYGPYIRYGCRHNSYLLLFSTTTGSQIKWQIREGYFDLLKWNEKWAWNARRFLSLILRSV